jgi:hypothetical protein
VQRKSVAKLLVIGGGLAAWTWLALKYTRPIEASTESQVIAAYHPHGEHVCYCPACGREITVGTGIPCNTQTCPACGVRMRAKGAGEYRY